MPISESDPQKFFEILASKLAKVLDEQNEKPLKIKSFSNSHLPTYDHFENNEINQYEDIDFDDQEEETNLSNVLKIPVENEPRVKKESFPLNCRHLLKNVESDIDVQLEEHIDRVYNNSNGEHDHSQVTKETRQHIQANSTKMCIKASANGDKTKNKYNVSI